MEYKKVTNKIISWVKTIVGLIIFVLIGNSLFANGGSSANRFVDDSYEEEIESQESLRELAYENWDEVMDYMSGTETIESCSDSGCYDLDADISNGYIETVYFPNGGYISPDAAIDENGSAEGYDGDDQYWEFYVDIDSSVVQDAIDEWVSDYEDSREDQDQEYRATRYDY